MTSTNSAESPFRAGYVALAGRPNVGKSTLLNALVGERLAITTPKPQTTRDRILGINTGGNFQMVFIDTPGMHAPRNRLGEYMVEEATNAYRDADVVLFLVEPRPPRDEDRRVAAALGPLAVPTILVVNKVDRVPKHGVAAAIDAYRHLGTFAEIVPVSASRGTGLDLLHPCIVSLLPVGPAYYPEDLLTDRTERFIAAEIVREQVMMRTGDEIPFSIAVEIDSFQELADGGAKIRAVVYVERESQKGIIIGSGGAKLKSIGIGARKKISSLIGGPVHLSLWVKVKREWRDNPGSLRQLGYGR